VTSSQLPLGFPFPPHQRFESFHDIGNETALALARDAAARSDAPWTYFAGADGAGKTHLLIAACQATSRRTQYLPLAKLGAAAESALIACDDFELLCIDDVHRVAGHQAIEIALFDVFNRGCARGATLLVAARQPPGLLPLALPDLASRLRSMTLASMRPLDEAARREVLRARAAARGFELDDAVLEFMFRRHARDLGTLFALLDRVDRESLAQQRRITVPFLRRIMGLPSRET
jgi:DnaA family protein